MDLLRFIQNIQDTKGSLTSAANIECKGKAQTMYNLKESLITKYENRVRELEEEVAELKKNNKAIVTKLENNAVENKEMTTMLKNYEELVNKVMTDNDSIRKEREIEKVHLDVLETSFKELLQKYEKAKGVVKGLEENQKVLQTQLGKYEQIIKLMENKYVGFKSYAAEKLNKVEVPEKALLNPPKTPKSEMKIEKPGSRYRMSKSYSNNK